MSEFYIKQQEITISTDEHNFIIHYPSVRIWISPENERYERELLKSLKRPTRSFDDERLQNDFQNNYMADMIGDRILTLMSGRQYAMCSKLMKRLHDCMDAIKIIKDVLLTLDKYNLQDKDHKLVKHHLTTDIVYNNKKEGYLIGIHEKDHKKIRYEINLNKKLSMALQEKTIGNLHEDTKKWLNDLINFYTFLIQRTGDELYNYRNKIPREYHYFLNIEHSPYFNYRNYIKVQNEKIYLNFMPILSIMTNGSSDEFQFADSLIITHNAEVLNYIFGKDEFVAEESFKKYYVPDVLITVERVVKILNKEEPMPASAPNLKDDSEINNIIKLYKINDSFDKQRFIVNE